MKKYCVSFFTVIHPGPLQTKIKADFKIAYVTHASSSRVALARCLARFESKFQKLDHTIAVSVSEDKEP